jgi:hypothetical protein
MPMTIDYLNPLAEIDETLLAVDLGVRTGLALYGRDGRLRWYRSHNFGSAARLRRGARALLAEIPGVSWLVMEGGGDLADIWAEHANRLAIEVRQISAGTWREAFLYPREQRSGPQAKQTANMLARRVIDWAGAPRPTSLRHDAAEAILVGLWGVLHLGWLDSLPPELKR